MNSEISKWILGFKNRSCGSSVAAVISVKNRGDPGIVMWIAKLQGRSWDNIVNLEIPAYILVFQCGSFGNNVNLRTKGLI